MRELPYRFRDVTLSGGSNTDVDAGELAGIQREFWPVSQWVRLVNNVPHHQHTDITKGKDDDDAG